MKGGAARKQRQLVCTIHHVPFVRPEPYFDGNSNRVPAARCPICVEKQRQKVAALLGAAPRKRTPSRQRPVVMIKEFEK